MTTFLGIPRRAAHDESPLRGTESFPKAAKREVANTQLRRNLGNATATIRAKRAAVVGELPDWEALRDAGSAVKQQVMKDLPALLEQLEAAVTARGGVVHWAADAEEANRIVTELVRAKGADEVVKVKSMATQEIGLNEYLEEQGIAAFETDLAELIVQLGHDKPSHILVPAIHRNRSEIREIFLREMPYAPADLTDEPRRLAMAAREHLRKKFLSAKVAISGANFAIADTGTLAVVESEGNGRMCLTLPETLITVMGIEKLLPTFSDLEVFLQLLPRSSTGERMNPYTSLWTGVTPGDGPQEFHLVLLDNGRTKVLADEVGRAALHCIRCSACLNVCPVYERAGGHAYGSVYPGPIGAILTPQLTGVSGHDDPNASLPFASSLCGACFDACPVKIDIPTILVELRGRAVDADRHRKIPGGWDAAMKAASWAMSSEKRFATAEKGLKAGRLLAGKKGRISSLPWPLSAWTGSRDLPEPPKQTFRDWWASEHVAPPTPRSPAQRGEDTSPATKQPPSFAGTATRGHRNGDEGAGSVPAAERGRGARLHSSRDVILDRIRSAIADAPTPSPVPREYRTTGTSAPGSAEAIELLVDRLEDYKASVRVIDESDLSDAVTAALEPVRSLVIANGLDQRIADAARGNGRAVTIDGEPNTLSSAELDGIEAVLTQAKVAIAVTGTIILDAGPGQGRRAITLVPDRHLVVLWADQVVESVPEGIGRLTPTSPLTMISGPSATSDIELSRVEGVHGPRTLDVLIVRP